MLSTSGFCVSKLYYSSSAYAILAPGAKKRGHTPKRGPRWFLKAVNPARFPLAPIRHRPLADSDLGPDLGIAQALRPQA